jgi:hypothetical protein
MQSYAEEGAAITNVGYYGYMYQHMKTVVWNVSLYSSLLGDQAKFCRFLQMSIKLFTVFLLTAANEIKKENANFRWAIFHEKCLGIFLHSYL